MFEPCKSVIICAVIHEHLQAKLSTYQHDFVIYPANYQEIG